MSNGSNDFYRDHYNKVIIGLIAAVILMLILVVVVLYQVSHRPLPEFIAISADKKQMELTAAKEPNLLSSTLIAWANKAAVAAYTFDFVNYEKEIALARPYFTDAGWNDYQASVAKLIKTITQNQLFVNAVVSGPIVISNQGELPNLGYAWRMQMPFLVTYQSAQSSSHSFFTVLMTIVKVSTSKNPAGIGIEQFIMME
jgi:intracellular multiplication protein IcmL